MLSLQPRFFLLFAACALGSAVDGAKPKPVVWNNAGVALRDGVTHHTLRSDAMEREVGYTVYQPTECSEAGRRFPVVYFLHGAGGDENADGPAFSDIVERMVKSGSVPPVICVFPNGGRSGYRDNAEGNILVETMLIEELLPTIDRDFRTLPQRESRAIAGYSMGGGGALRLALKYPELFSVAGSWAGAVGPPHAKPLLNELPPDSLQPDAPRVRLLMIVGYQDEATYAAHAPLVAGLTEAGYPYTYRTLANVPHKLGLYYQLTGDSMARFLIKDLEVARQ